MPSAPVLLARLQVVPMRTSLGFQLQPSATVSVRPSLYDAARVSHVVVVADMKKGTKRVIRGRLSL